MVRELLSTVLNNVHIQHHRGKCYHLSSWKWSIRDELLHIYLKFQFPSLLSKMYILKRNSQTFPCFKVIYYSQTFPETVTAIPYIIVPETKHYFLLK